MKNKSVVISVIVFLGICGIGCGIVAYQRMHMWQVTKKHFGSGGGGQLVYAALIGDEKTFERCLAQGVPVDVRDDSGYTPLQASVIFRKRNAVLLLLEHGADPNLKNHNGATAAMLAVDLPGFTGDTWYLETLLRHGVDPNPEMEKAITFSSLPMVKLLVAAGADVHRNDPAGHTYLYSAACANSYDILYYLLQQGVDPKNDKLGVNDLLHLINDNQTYLPPPDDCRPKVIDWLKKHNEWKDKEELWKEEEFLPRQIGRGIHGALPKV